MDCTVEEVKGTLRTRYWTLNGRAESHHLIRALDALTAIETPQPFSSAYSGNTTAEYLNSKF